MHPIVVDMVAVTCVIPIVVDRAEIVRVTSLPPQNMALLVMRDGTVKPITGPSARRHGLI